jgi:TolA-binding protein
MFISQNEILDNENKNLKQKEDGDYQEVSSLKSSLQSANREIEQLKGRIEELEQLNKELRKKQNENLSNFMSNSKGGTNKPDKPDPAEEDVKYYLVFLN